MEKIKYDWTEDEIYHEVLPNGLNIYLYPNPKAQNVYMTFTVKFGSIHTEFKLEGEKKYKKIPNGTAHFLEHQLFQDEDENVHTKFAKLGSSINAYTTYEHTTYEVLTSNNFKENLNLLLDYVQNPVFKKTSVDKEKGIIKEEIDMYKNIPNSRLVFENQYNLNIKDNHKYRITGEVEDIQNVTPEILYDTYNTFYEPANMFVVIAGKFEALEAIGIIKENQAKKEFKPYKKAIIKDYHEPIKVENPLTKINMDIHIPKIKISYKFDKNIFKDFDEVELKLCFIALFRINFGVTSTFLESLMDGGILTRNIGIAPGFKKDYMSITFTGETEYTEEFINQIREKMQNLEITWEELERTKKSCYAAFVDHFDDIVDVTEDIICDIIENGHIISNIKEIYDSLTLDKMKELKDLINGDVETITIIEKES